jgi:hypothetical protein
MQEAPAWRTRSRWSAALPILSVHGSRDVNWQEGSSSSHSSVGAIDRAQGVDVRLTWRLDRLLFDPDEPRLFDAEQKARKARVTLDQEVARSYFLWRKAVAARPAGADLTFAEGETFAQVDAFTGGWLTRTHCQ